MPRPRLLFLITEDWYFWTHRCAIARAAQAAGFEVIVATRVQKHGSLIRGAGFRLIPIRLRRRSRNPIQELLAIAELAAIYRRERPAIVHHVTIKPVLYGTWAAALAGVPAVVNALAGLGHAFVAQGWRALALKRLIIFAYRTTLGLERSRVIFQNPEDREAFVHNGIVAADKAILIRGAGVNLAEFCMRPEPDGTPVVMLAGRLLWSKGVKELIEAAELLRARNVPCRVVLVGVPDLDNPNSVEEETLRTWQRDGVVEWWGRREDMPDVLAQSNVVVLPTTYGEGVPKILLEAAAIGRAIVATDVPGCREIVKHGENGLLVPAGDVSRLAAAMGELLENPAQRARMGRRGREIVQAEFAEEQIVAQTLAVYHTLLGEQSPGKFKLAQEP